MKRVLFATTALVGISMLAGAARATDIYITDQVNTGEQKAFAVISGSGTSVDSTVAAIGNSLAVNLEKATSVAKFDIFQGNFEDQIAVNKINVNTAAGLDGPISGTAAAIGNTLTGVTDPVTGGTGIGGDLANLDVTQINKGFQIGVNDVSWSKASSDATHVSTFVAAAIGNSIGLTAGSIGGSADFDKVVQINKGLGELAVNNLAHDNFGGPLSATAAAIGNTATLATNNVGAEGGTLNLDKLTQVNGGNDSFTLGQLAINNLDDSAVQRVANVGSTSSTWNVDLTAAAIGNTASLTSVGTMNLGEVTQVNKPILGQAAITNLDDLHGVKDLTVTTAALGNSFSAAATGNFALGSLDQDNYRPQLAVLNASDLGAVGNVSTTTAAIGNSISISAGSVSGNANLSSFNGASQTAVTALGGKLGALSATTAAIGNSASITVH
jgi:hypothetical protein